MALAAGNPSSMHACGRRAARLLQEARERIASALGAAPRQVVFTSGATESNNLALRGSAWRDPQRLLLTSPLEHVSVLKTLEELADRGARVETVAVDSSGRLDSSSLLDRASSCASLIALSWANGETGHIADIPEIAGKLAEQTAAGLPIDAILHVDASQALGRLPVHFHEGIATMAFAGHKIGGPLGIGALLVRGVTPKPLMSGGSHEGGLRPGTENVPGAIGLAVAVELAYGEFDQEAPRLAALRETLWDLLSSRLPDVLRITPPDGLPNTLTVAVADVGSDVLIAALDLAGYCVSSGSACASGSPEPSHVIKALGVPAPFDRGVIRISMGKATSGAEIRGFADAFVEAIGRARRAA
jgi:cysteine desulfurase